MHLTCPSCHDRFPIAAGFLDDDGKRLAALLADMEPVLGRAVIGYLRLFKPARQGLRIARAVKLVRDLNELVRVGSVCRDERGGVRRPATPAMWAEGIEQMLAESAGLTLPLTNHRYLRAIVYGLADKADADRERQREADLRVGRRPVATSENADTQRRNDLREALRRIETDLDLEIISPAEAKKRAADARQKYGGAA